MLHQHQLRGVIGAPAPPPRVPHPRLGTPGRLLAAATVFACALPACSQMERIAGRDDRSALPGTAAFVVPSSFDPAALARRVGGDRSIKSVTVISADGAGATHEVVRQFDVSGGTSSNSGVRDAARVDALRRLATLNPTGGGTGYDVLAGVRVALSTAEGAVRVVAWDSGASTIGGTTINGIDLSDAAAVRNAADRIAAAGVLPSTYPGGSTIVFSSAGGGSSSLEAAARVRLWTSVCAEITTRDLACSANEGEVTQ